MLRYTVELDTVSPAGHESLIPSRVTVEADSRPAAVSEAIRKYLHHMPPGGAWGIRRWRIVMLQPVPG
jgi:hypothetical protein